jgi:hypothetical protein
MWHQGIARRRCTDGLCPNGLDCPAGRTYRGEYAPRPIYQPCPDDCGTCDSNLHVRLSYAYGARSSSRRSKRERGTAMSSPFSFALAIYHQLARHDSCEQKVGPKPRSCPTTSSRSAPSTRRTLATASHLLHAQRRAAAKVELQPACVSADPRGRGLRMGDDAYTASRDEFYLGIAPCEREAHCRTPRGWRRSVNARPLRAPRPRIAGASRVDLRRCVRG